MAYGHNNTVDTASGLRAADAASRPVAAVAAGPFDVSRPSGAEGPMPISDALITGLLIVYPVVATVVAAIVGLFLAGPIV